MADSEEIVLPHWQPDDELSSCSICGAHFTFLTRRHHCRRCGRLVCATCSPHRITIPRQYIVKPPEDRLWDEDAPHTRSRSGTDASEYVDNLGGGETVRVCNPCVPDPNYGPPPQHENPTSPPLPPSTRSRASTYAHDIRRTGSTQPRDFARSETNVGDELIQTQSRSAPFRARFSGATGRPGMQRALQSMPQTQRMRASTSTQRTRSDDSVFPSRQRYRTTSTAPTSADVDPRSQLVATSTIAERPQSRDTTSSEEDECPVCGTREPPFGPEGVSVDRERHVEDCLSNHFLFSAGPSTRAVPGPGIEPPENPLQPGTPTSPGAFGAPSPSVRQRMLVYHATEKDCFDESGDPQECVICFDEFQPGDEMGRLECLCRFHRTCIKSWWLTKGPGSCPTHQLHS